jgi:hypothetical protein
MALTNFVESWVDETAGLTEPERLADGTILALDAHLPELLPASKSSGRRDACPTVPARPMTGRRRRTPDAAPADGSIRFKTSASSAAISAELATTARRLTT